MRWWMLLALGCGGTLQGQWDGSCEVEGEVVGIDIYFNQDSLLGSKTGGAINLYDGEEVYNAGFDGTVKGDEVSASFQIKIDEVRVPAEFTGTRDGDDLAVDLTLQVDASRLHLRCELQRGAVGDGPDHTDPSTSGEGCAWVGSEKIAPEGAYDCSEDDTTLLLCVRGQWETVVECDGLWNSDGYVCDCKGGLGNGVTECSYAFEVCGGQSYETCGDRATEGVEGGSWVCIPD